MRYEATYENKRKSKKNPSTGGNYVFNLAPLSGGSGIGDEIIYEGISGDSVTVLATNSDSAFYLNGTSNVGIGNLKLGHKSASELTKTGGVLIGANN